MQIRRKLEQGIVGSVWQKNKFEGQGKSSNGVRGRDTESEESAIEVVGCGRNGDVEMDEWSYKTDMYE